MGRASNPELDSRAQPLAVSKNSSAADEFKRHCEGTWTQSFCLYGEKKAARSAALEQLRADAEHAGFVAGTLDASQLPQRTDEYAFQAISAAVEQAAATLSRRQSIGADGPRLLAHLATALRPEEATAAAIEALWAEEKLLPSSLVADQLEDAVLLLGRLAEKAGTKALLFVDNIQMLAPRKGGYQHILPSLLMATAHAMRETGVALVVSGPRAATARALASYPDSAMMFSSAVLGPVLTDSRTG